jgi:hypothetical protein
MREEETSSVIVPTRRQTSISSLRFAASLPPFFVAQLDIGIRQRQRRDAAHGFRVQALRGNLEGMILHWMSVGGAGTPQEAVPSKRWRRQWCRAGRERRPPSPSVARECRVQRRPTSRKRNLAIVYHRFDLPDVTPCAQCACPPHSRTQSHKQAPRTNAQGARVQGPADDSLSLGGPRPRLPLPRAPILATFTCEKFPCPARFPRRQSAPTRNPFPELESARMFYTDGNLRLKGQSTSLAREVGFPTKGGLLALWVLQRLVPTHDTISLSRCAGPNCAVRPFVALYIKA